MTSAALMVSRMRMTRFRCCSMADMYRSSSSLGAAAAPRGGEATVGVEDAPRPPPCSDEEDMDAGSGVGVGAGDAATDMALLR